MDAPSGFAYIGNLSRLGGLLATANKREATQRDGRGLTAKVKKAKDVLKKSRSMRL